MKQSMFVRREAQKQYEVKLAACRAAENISEEAWMKAEAELAVARTTQTRQASNLLRLRNRGLDV